MSIRDILIICRCLQWAAAIAGNPNFKRSLGEVMIEGIG